MKNKRSPYGHRTGSWHHRSRYSTELVEEIRAKHQPKISRSVDGACGIQALANEYNIPFSTIRDWVQYRTRTSS